MYERRSLRHERSEKNDIEADSPSYDFLCLCIWLRVSMKRTRVLARRCAAHRQSDHFLRQLDDDERIAAIVKATLLFNILKSERGQKPLHAGRVGFVTLGE